MSSPSTVMLTLSLLWPEDASHQNRPAEGPERLRTQDGPEPEPGGPQSPAGPVPLTVHPSAVRPSCRQFRDTEESPMKNCCRFGLTDRDTGGQTEETSHLTNRTGPQVLVEQSTHLETQTLHTAAAQRHLQVAMETERR